MANTITKTTLEQGVRNLIVKVDIESDGTAAADVILIDASDYVDIALEELRVDALKWSMNDFIIELSWDATANKFLYTMHGPGEDEQRFSPPIHNITGAGKTGDILYTATGMTTGENATITFYLKKRTVT